MISKNELALISHLRKNSRESYLRLSKATGIPVSTLFGMIRRFNSRKLTRHTVLLDFSQIGFTLRAAVMLRVDRGQREALAKHLKNSGFLNSLLRITGGFDYLCECVFSNHAELEEFVEGIKEKFTVQQLSVHPVVEELEKEAFLSEPSLSKSIKS